MPTREEFLTFFGTQATPEDLRYYEGINWDPRMVLVMKAQTVKAGFARRGLRHLTGEVGALVLTYQQNVACTEKEWAEVKENYTKLLALEEHHKAKPAPDKAVEIMLEAQRESLQSSPPQEEASRCCACVIQ